MRGTAFLIYFLRETSRLQLSKRDMAVTLSHGTDFWTPPSQSMIALEAVLDLEISSRESENGKVEFLSQTGRC